jgi:hypothetical protein
VFSGNTEGTLMLAALATLALFGFALAMLTEMLRRDGRKILAALQGRSWISEPQSPRPVTVRFSHRYPATQPLRARPLLRAAA